MRRWLFVSLVLHAAAIGAAVWWLAGPPETDPPLALRVDLGPRELPARQSSVPRSSTLPTPSPELPPAEMAAPSPDESSPDADPGLTGDAGGPVIDALTPGQSLEQPVLLGYPPPDYPREARKKGWQGVVEIEVTVDEMGRAVEIVLSQSSGHGELDQSALAALRGARYKPGTVDGAPQKENLTVTVRFRLQ